MSQEPAGGPCQNDGGRKHGIDGTVFRRVLGRFPTGVVGITGVFDNTAVGLAVGSFMSVSLDPPLVAFGVDHQSTTWPRIQTTGTFCVNVFNQEQDALCRVFATSGADKFRGVDWAPTRAGSPVIKGALAWIDCTIEAEHRAGDHNLVIGRVRDLGTLDDHATPLVFFGGEFGGFQASPAM